MFGSEFAGDSSGGDGNRDAMPELIGCFTAYVQAFDRSSFCRDDATFSVTRQTAERHLIGRTRLLSVEGSLVDSRED